MEFLELMKIYKRMCKSRGGHDCMKCPISSTNNGTLNVCSEFVCNHPEVAEAILIDWDTKNPVKTRLTDLKEKYPNFVMTRDINTGVEFPKVCARYLGYVATCPGIHCKDCWDTIISE